MVIKGQNDRAILGPPRATVVGWPGRGGVGGVGGGCRGRGLSQEGTTHSKKPPPVRYEKAVSTAKGLISLSNSAEPTSGWGRPPSTRKFYKVHKAAFFLLTRRLQLRRGAAPGTTAHGNPPRPTEWRVGETQEPELRRSSQSDHQIQLAAARRRLCLASPGNSPRFFLVKPRNRAKEK